MSRLKTVVQATSKTTAVTNNTYTGIVETVALTDVAGGAFDFTVNNSKLKSFMIPLITTEYDGEGTPLVNLVSHTKGSFVVRVTNVHTADAFDASLKVLFTINQ
jgi:hypothetical protein